MLLPQPKRSGLGRPQFPAASAENPYERVADYLRATVHRPERPMQFSLSVPMTLARRFRRSVSQTFSSTGQVLGLWPHLAQLPRSLERESLPLSFWLLRSYTLLQQSDRNPERAATSVRICSANRHGQEHSTNSPIQSLFSNRLHNAEMWRPVPPSPVSRRNRELTLSWA